MGTTEHEDRTIEVLRNPEDVQGAARRWERKGWEVVHASSGSWSGSVRLHLQRPVSRTPDKGGQRRHT